MQCQPAHQDDHEDDGKDGDRSFDSEFNKFHRIAPLAAASFAVGASFATTALATSAPTLTTTIGGLYANFLTGPQALVAADNDAVAWF